MRLGLPTPDRHTLPDVAAVGISAAMGAALARTVPPDSPVPAAVVLTACLLLSATLLWRRTHPMAVLWSATAAEAPITWGQTGPPPPPHRGPRPILITHSREEPTLDAPTDRLRPIDLARAAGISTQQVRNHADEGVLPPTGRTASGYRILTDLHRRALLTFRALSAGFDGACGGAAE
ncbi:MerR family DNA-binding transcriptional regulator, partial [Streptomyces sp. NPDC000931]|uniref:MerR family DNA-binding transcriptional regulator n=1 Tax=Streptomyces sp. NPDC000931 TaxID=3154372 RepID=UPI00331A90FC